MKNLTEQDLNNLINEHLENCKGYSEVCRLTATPTGKQRVVSRIKQIIKQDGITSIEACLAQIESELIMDV
jgi:hypothetical protein